MKQGCRGEGISTPTPISFPKDFCGNPHGDPHIDIPIWISIWGSPQGKIIFLFSTQFHGYGDPYWDIRMDIHTDIPIPM